MEVEFKSIEGRSFHYYVVLTVLAGLALAGRTGGHIGGDEQRGGCPDGADEHGAIIWYACISERIFKRRCKALARRDEMQG